MTQPPSAGLRPTRAYRWLAALPGLAMLAGAVFANRARPLVLGLPFLLFWILVWVLATAAVMAFIYRADEAVRRRIAAECEPGLTQPRPGHGPGSAPASGAGPDAAAGDVAPRGQGDE